MKSLHLMIYHQQTSNNKVMWFGTSEQVKITKPVWKSVNTRWLTHGILYDPDSKYRANVANWSNAHSPCTKFKFRLNNNNSSSTNPFSSYEFGFMCLWMHPSLLFFFFFVQGKNMRSAKCRLLSIVSYKHRQNSMKLKINRYFFPLQDARKSFKLFLVLFTMKKFNDEIKEIYIYINCPR